MGRFVLNQEERIELARDCSVGGWSYAKAARYYGVHPETARRYTLAYLAIKSNERYPSGRVKYAYKPKKLLPCGTNAGYRRHIKNKELACSKCLKAHAKELKRYRAEQKKKRSSSSPTIRIPSTVAAFRDQTPRTGVSTEISSGPSILYIDPRVPLNE